MKGVLPVSLLRRELRQQFGDDTQASIAWFISRTKKPIACSDWLSCFVLLLPSVGKTSVPKLIDKLANDQA